MSTLKIENLNKSFDNFNILKNINCILPSGTITGLIGNNGAGKTTLIKCLTSFYEDYTGEISIGNTFNITADKISYIPDIPVYYEELTLGEHARFISAMYGNSEKVDGLIGKLDLRSYLNKFPQELSKGTLQRMMILLALLRKYELLIADEPFSGLDPTQVLNVKNLFLSEKNQGKTVLISSHQLNIVQEICDRFIIIDNGNIVYETPNPDNSMESSNENIEELYHKFFIEDSNDKEGNDE